MKEPVRLTEAQRQEVIDLIESSTLSNKALGAMFNVDPTTIGRIWKKYNESNP